MRLTQLLVCVVMIGCESISEQPAEIALTAALSGPRVKPAAVQSAGSGSLTATLSSLNGDGQLDYTLSFSGLTDNATSAHLHGPADTASAGTVLIDLSAIPVGGTGTIALGAKSGTGQGSINLTVPVNATVSGDSVHKLLHAGLVYIDVHTLANPAGEIRGQIRKN